MSKNAVKRNQLTQAVVRALLTYDGATGLLYWIDGARPRFSNKTEAGFVNEKGYRIIEMFGVRYAAHRLVWLWHHGEWPKMHIDHINGTKSDNRLENLRDVDAHCNMQNQFGAHKNSITGVLGVSVDRDRFRARITVHGKKVHLGKYRTKNEAHDAYLRAKRNLHPGTTI